MINRLMMIMLNGTNDRDLIVVMIESNNDRLMMTVINRLMMVMIV